MKYTFNINEVFNHISKIENEWINYNSMNLKGYWTNDDLTKYQPLFRIEMRVYNVSEYWLAVAKKNRENRLIK